MTGIQKLIELNLKIMNDNRKHDRMKVIQKILI